MGRKGEQETELRRIMVAEMAALKAAKLALAEVLAAIDEVRLQERRRAAELQREIDAAQVEGARLRALLDSSLAPKSFGASLWRLVAEARGGNDQSGPRHV